MPEIRPDQLLLPSVLDRLIDHDPEVAQEPSKSRNQLLRDLKQSVRRDLENLLNTRIRCVPPPPGLAELEASLVAYGLPDLAGGSLGTSQRREKFRRTIHATILQFEPRLKKPKVRLLDDGETADRSLRFQIEAVLQAEPAPEPIAFDSTLRLTTGTFEVKGLSDG